MTKTQETIWRKKMIALEERILQYFSEHNNDPSRVKSPDGSFAMNAFRAGYRLGRRMRE